MIKLLVPTNNPIKIEAVSDAFVKFFSDSFEIESISVKEQDKFLCTSSYQTLLEAAKRTQIAKTLRADFNYYIGIETGIEYIDNDLYSFNWVVILHNGKSGKAKSQTYKIPENIKIDFEKGGELGSIVEKYYGKDSIDNSNGMLATLSNGKIYRKKIIENTVILALSSLQF